MFLSLNSAHQKCFVIVRYCFVPLTSPPPKAACEKGVTWELFRVELPTDISDVFPAAYIMIKRAS